jgi:hypothetical protein
VTRLVLADTTVNSMAPDSSQQRTNVANPRFVVRFSEDVMGGRSKSWQYRGRG